LNSALIYLYKLLKTMADSKKIQEILASLYS